MEYEYTANTLSMLELISISHCARWWGYKKNKTEPLSWSWGGLGCVFYGNVVGVSREQGAAQTTERLTSLCTCV